MAGMVPGRAFYIDKIEIEGWG